MSNNYTSSDIKVLDEIVHIQKNAGMYIGETENPVHLIEELLDNSLDECVGGYGRIVAINIDTKKFIYSGIDNGRGIPLENNVPKVISTKLFSGAKFQGEKSAYEVCSGKHGVGLVAINALSELYEIEIYRDNKHALFKFENSKFKNETIESFNQDVPFSTKITFKPSGKYFEKLIPNIDRIRKRLVVASVELPNCIFVLNIDDKKEIIKNTKNDFFQKHCLSESDSNVTPKISIKLQEKVEKFNIDFCYALSGSTTPRVVTSVNLLPVDGGGTHVNIFYDILRDIFKNYKKKMGIKFQTNDCLCGLRSYLSLSLKEPEFSSQTKDKLINRKVSLQKLTKRIKSKIEEYFSNNSEQLDELLEHFERYRKKLDSKNIKSNNVKTRLSTKFTKLKDCTGNNGEIFIVEGISAGGTFTQCRDPRKHAIFSLKGKIPNIVNSKDILKNKELCELIRSLGCGVKGIDFDISKLRYDKIICATDADADGDHIASLLILSLAILVPDVIKNGYVYIVKTPLYAITEAKKFIPIWTDLELKEAKKNNKKISRFKGLGELNSSQLKVSAIDEKTRKLIPVTYTDNIEKIKKLFSSAEEKRKLLEEK